MNKFDLVLYKRRSRLFIPVKIQIFLFPILEGKFTIESDKNH